jgi:hypothetical protein
VQSSNNKPHDNPQARSTRPAACHCGRPGAFGYKSRAAWPRRPEQRPTFVLTLRAMPDAPGIRALRWLLKVLLRKHKLHRISIEERSCPRVGGGARS